MSNSPQRPRNPPGLAALVYRVSDYTQAKQRALESLYIAIPPATSTLAALRTRDGDDATIALIDAWAMVIDVLTFYQERIANEGYWRTATERRSLLELARTIGCELQPGVAASTWVMFTVESTPTAPTQVTVPKGTQIASVPGENEQSQTFETSEPLTARVDWNLLKPRLTRPQTLTPQTQQVYLQGTNTQLQVGDRVLLIDEPGQGESLPDRGKLLTLTAVELLTASEQTRIAWEPPLATVPRRPRLFAFRQQAALFGNLAPPWETLPAETKQRYSPVKGGSFRLTGQEWRSVTIGLPSLDVRCLAVKPPHFLFAGTLGSGVFRSLDRGESWQAMTIGLSNLAIETLYCSEQGQVFAGTPGGGVFRSRDNGETWTAINSGTVRVQATGPNSWESVNTALPNTVVRCLLAYIVLASLEFLFVGTDDGVYRSPDQGQNWYGKGLGTRVVHALLQSAPLEQPGQGTVKSVPKEPDKAQSLTGLQIEAAPFEPALKTGQLIRIDGTDYIITTIDHSQNILTIYPPLAKALDQAISFERLPSYYLYAATDQGVYRSADHGNQWALSSQAFTAPTTCLALLPQTADLFAGTASDGVYRSRDGGDTWERRWTSTDHLGITALAVYRHETDGTRLYAGTSSGRLFVSIDRGETWQECDMAPIATGVLAMASSPEDLFVGTRFSGFANTDWSPSGQPVDPATAITPPPPTTALDLNALYPQILPDSWIVLLNHGLPNQPQMQPLQVQTVSTTLATGFTLAAQVTRLTLQPSFDPNHYHPQTTIVLVQSEPLTLAATSLTLESQQAQIERAIATMGARALNPAMQAGCFQDPIGRNYIFLEQFVQGLQPGQKLIVSGQRPRLEILQVGGVFWRQTLGEAWERHNQGLSNLSVLSLLTTQQGILAGTTNGLFRQQSSTLPWEAIADTPSDDKDTLAACPIRVLHRMASGVLLAGTEFGLWRSQDGGLTWKALNQFLPPAPVFALASAPNAASNAAPNGDQASEILYLATAYSLFRSLDQGESWVAINRNLFTAQVQSLAVNTQGHLFAGTQQHGVFRSLDQGDTWTLVGYSGKSGTGAIASSGRVVVGTGTVFSEELQPGNLLIALGQTRTIVGLDPDQPNSCLTIDEPFAAPGLPAGTPFMLSTGLTNLNVTALATCARSGTGRISVTGTRVTGKETDFLQELRIGDAITVGNQSGVVIEIASGTRCTLATAFERAVTDQPFTTPMVFAGTAGGGVFRSSNNGERWQAMNQGLTDLTVTTLIAYEHPGRASLWIAGTTIAASSRIPVPVEALMGALITVARQTRRVTAILDEGLSEITFSINVAFDLPSQPRWSLPGFPFMAVGSQFMAEDTDYTVQTLMAGTERGGVFYSLNQGERWIADSAGLTNTAIRAIAPPQQATDPCLVGGVGILPSPDGLESVPLAPGDSLQVLAAPTVLPSPVALRWHLRNVNGFEGILTSTTAADVTLHPALATDEVNSELVTLLTPVSDQQTPVALFQEPLQACYDPASVGVHANVVAATHGETIAGEPEVLGSGDGTLANQRFFLKKPPLTYVSAATATGIASSLEVRVNDLLWKSVPALYGLQPTDQVYLVQTDNEGNTRITFGDGINGARLPSGVDNVVATYRSGIGVAGNLAAGKISLLKTRPLGIQAVNNPLPATGGADRENQDQVRERAPLTVRTLDRIVSLQDVEDFTRTFPGISKATAVSLWADQAPVIHVTIAGSDGAEIPPDAALHQTLVQAIARVRDPYQPPPVIASCERVWFELAATLLIDPRYLPDRVQATVQAQLQQTFSFANRDFGQPVAAAEAIALIQSIPGVMAVDLDFLHRVNAPKTLEQSLTASLARWHPATQQFTPAQILCLRRAILTIEFPTP